MKRYIEFAPICLVTAYLLLTIFLFYFGPLIWPLENQTKFNIYITLYVLALIFGYIGGRKFFFYVKIEKKTINQVNNFLENKILKNIGLICFFSLIASFIYHRNLVHTASYIPWTFFSDVYKGLLHPALVRNYYASESYQLNFGGNVFVSSFLIFLSVFKYSLLPISIYYWDKLKTIQKILCCCILLIPLCSGIAISLSSINFFYMFTVATCLIIVILLKGLKGLFDRKFWIISLLMVALFSFWQFYYVKSGVSLYQALSNEGIKSARFNYLEDYGIRFKVSQDERTPLQDYYEKLTIYLVQGYLGMSYALGEKFETTYGMGHSSFLTKVIDKYLNFDIGSRTYQRKISGRWDEYVFWHSAYSYFANDVGFPGVVIVMFVMGWCFSFIFMCAIHNDDIIAKILIPLFGIFFLYLPANNQVFSFLETMSSFWILTFLFIILYFVNQRSIKKRIFRE